MYAVVFWAILFSGSFASVYVTWKNVSQHALNSAAALFEIAVPRTAPLPWLNLPVLVFILALYLALAYLTYHTQHFFVYGFLDYNVHSAGSVAGYCFGILAGIIVVFVVVHFLVWLRVWVTEKKLGMLGKISRKDPARSDPAQRAGSDVELAVKR